MDPSLVARHLPKKFPANIFVALCWCKLVSVVLSRVLSLLLLVFRIRDLNDEINKLIREKGHWEKRIVELGGPNYAKSAPKVTDAEGNELQGATGKGQGYKYFGAARLLPGVKELFEKEPPRKVSHTPCTCNPRVVERLVIDDSSG